MTGYDLRWRLFGAIVKYAVVMLTVVVIAYEVQENTPPRYCEGSTIYLQEC